MFDRDRLIEAKAGLTAAIAEFKEASNINDGLEDDIGRPDDRSELRDKASDFESAWDGKRDKLRENLEKILERLTAIIDNWDEWDTTTAASFDNTETTTQNVNRVA